MFKKLAISVLGIATSVGAQIVAPQVTITGTLGAGGIFPLLNSGPMVLASCPHTLTYLETTAFVIKVTSTPTLSSPCIITAPTGYFHAFVENLTSGGQNVIWGGSTGTTVTIPNGAWALIIGDGTNYGTIASGGGSPGTVTNFAAGTWPSWLTPTVTNSTTTPSLAVTASAIPNSALAAINFSFLSGTATVAQLPTGIPNANLANSATMVNGQTCTLGSTCTITVGSSAFSSLTSGNNTTAAMVVGTGASLGASGTGTIAATTATALATTPGQCSGGQFATGVTAAGTANCGTPAGAGTVNSGTQYSPAYYAATGTAVSGVTPFSGLQYDSALAAPAAATSTQVQGVIGAGVYDASGAAATAQTAAQAYAANSSNQSSGTVANARLVNAGVTTINGTACTQGGSCSPSNPPAAATSFYPAAVSNGGTGTPASWGTYDNQQPQVGSIIPASSTRAYMAFNAGATTPQYAELTVSAPPYWTGTSMYIEFMSTAATTGNVTWEVQATCTQANAVVGSPTYSTAVASTTAVSTTSGGLAISAVLTNIAVPGTTSGCPASPTTPTDVTFRIYRYASDTATGNANFLGTTLVVGRSQ